MSGGQMTLTNLLAGLPVVILTTTGARSGLPHTTPLARITDPANPDRFAVIASNLGQPHHPAWYYNLKAHSRATVTIDHQVKSYIAHEARDEEYAMFWSYALDIYPGYQHYKERAAERHIPIIVLTLETSSHSRKE
jgi:deazaflavin-dependent oxidoreductase (nitroreductase family)